MKRSVPSIPPLNSTKYSGDALGGFGMSCISLACRRVTAHLLDMFDGRVFDMGVRASSP
jgi:hypothetical protein